MIADLHRQMVDQDKRLNALLCKQLEAEQCSALVHLTVTHLCDAIGIVLSTREVSGSQSDDGASGLCSRGVTGRDSARAYTLLKRRRLETDTI